MAGSGLIREGVPGPAKARPVNIGFLMDQIAGHVTNYRNLRTVADRDPAITGHWRELHYYVESGLFERARRRFPFIPQYATGVARGTLELHRGLRHGGFDVVFTNASVALLRRRALSRTPWMYDFDSTPKQRDEMRAYTERPDPEPVARLKKRMMGDLFHSATLLKAWSHWAKRSVVDDYGVSADKVIVNPPGVDLEFWRPAPEAQPASSGPRRVLFVGGDFRRKGGDLLLEWYRGQRPDEVELHIVTREEVPGNRPGVHVYHDMQPNTPELLALYHRCDVFALPSLGECFGIATVEAMAAGLPVIVTSVGGTADIVESGRNGFLVGADDGNALASALDAVLGDEQRRLAMGKQGRLMAEQRFDVEANARETLALLKQLAARERAQ